MPKQQGSASTVGQLPVRAELVFDSLRDPAPAGVRSSANGVRYLLFRAGPVVIDLRFEFTQDSERYSLSGQAQSTEENAPQLTGIPVLLRSERNELFRTRTNQFGEFVLQEEIGRSVEIHLEVPERNEIFIPLDEAFWQRSMAGL